MWSDGEAKRASLETDCQFYAAMMSVARRTDLGPKGLLESSRQRCWARDLDGENEGHAENPRKQASIPTASSIFDRPFDHF